MIHPNMHVAEEQPTNSEPDPRSDEARHLGFWWTIFRCKLTMSFCFAPSSEGESVVTWYPWYFLPLEVGFGYPKFAMNLADTQRPKGFCLTSRWLKFCSQQVRKELERKLQQEEKEKEQLEAQGQRTQDMVGQHVASAAVLVLHIFEHFLS